ncbi:MAG: hypothetical protein QNI84_07930 [Henriciella sp.]|nr:hypothetical protein [Henriciella sp.]
MARSPQVRTRLSQDSSAWRQDMREVEAQGDATLARIRNAASGTADQMGELGAQTGATAGSMHDLSGRSETFDRILASINPRVIAMAAGLASAGAAALVLFDQLQRSNEYASQILETADGLDITAEALQAVGLAAVEADVPIESVQKGLETFRKRSLEAAIGMGEFYTSLKDVAPEMVEAVNGVDSYEAKLSALLKQLDAYPNAQDRLIIAQKAFGDDGEDVLDVLGDQTDGLAALTLGYVDAGVIVSNETIAMGAELDREWDVFVSRMEQRWRKFRAGIVDSGRSLVLQLEEVRTDSHVRALERIVEQRDAVLQAAEQRLGTLVEKRNTLIANGKDAAADRMSGRIDRATKRVERANEKLIDAYDHYFEAFGSTVSDAGPLPEGATDTPPQLSFEDPEDEQGRRAARAERNRLEREAAKLLVEQGDIMPALTLERERLNKLLEAGLITQEQMELALAREKAALEAKTPIGKEQIRIGKELDQLTKSWADQAEREERARQRLNAQLKQAIQREGELLTQRFQTPEQRRDADLAHVGGLAELGVIDEDVLARSTEEIEESYQRAAEAASQYRDTQFTLEFSLMGLATGATEFGDVWKRVALQAVFDAIGLQESVTALSRSFRGLLEGFGGGIFGGLGLPQIGGNSIPVQHEGGYGRDATRYRAFNPLTDKPGARERLTMVDMDELVLRPDQVAGLTSGGGSTFVFSPQARGASSADLNAVQAEFEVFKGYVNRSIQQQPSTIRATYRDDQIRRGRGG